MLHSTISKAIPISIKTHLKRWLLNDRGQLVGSNLFRLWAKNTIELDFASRRRLIADSYLSGEGIEIGALNSPLDVPQSAKVKYVDRMTVAELRMHYQELRDVTLVEADIIADGERLETIPDNSQDFVIANHFIEHCQNPLLAFSNMLRVLKQGGILYLAIPDKQYTFDVDRPVTTIEHLLKDFQQGPEWSKRRHFEEWVRLVNKPQTEAEVQQQTDSLLGMDYSIHYHVWTQKEMFGLLGSIGQTLGLDFDIELFLKNGHECIFVLRKNA